ncbi:DUF349 domain-containing protein [Saccharophagus sp. K07]|uniref:DUF349 domain-containing protein n=1 Tax=Saccharophagus sp. K07 TaxID=2283636 RepID=UPI001651E301|nr:DUF349 domain-containing protein [Saccharophagus sp. K07]MBC6904828.1 DUF349 domain-containing protein [Saccharophagus sp. K07]
MSLFSRLFKSKQPETLEQKLAALEQASQEQLADYALTSSTEQVRLAAIKKLAFSDALFNLATREDISNTVQSAARKRIGELLDSGELTVEQLSKSTLNQSLLLALCGYSSQAGVSLLEQINNENLLLEIAVNGSTTQLRQAAAAKIENRTSLEQLAKQAKNKDKSVYKIVRTKLDVFKEEKIKEAQMAAEINAICSQAEQLAKRNVDDIFETRKKQIEAAWNQFAERASVEARQRYQQAIEKCQQKINEVIEKEKLLASIRAAEQEAKKEVHKAIITLQEFIAKLYNHPNPQELESELQEHTQQSLHAIEDAQNNGLNVQHEKQRLQELRTSASELLQKLRQSGSLSQLIESLQATKEEQGQKIKTAIDSIVSYARALKEVPPPEIVQHGKQTINEWSEQIKSKAESAKQHIRESAELIRKGNWAVSQGYVGRARAILKELESKVQEVDLPSHLGQKFEDLKLSIQKLGDWHQFAVTPKKEELIKQMRALENSDLHPKDLADKIHSLQEAWKELCRGGQNQDEELWQEFHAAAQTAYEPCKRYFDEQSQIREHNASLRRTLLEQLTQYLNAYDWENANWKEVEKTLRASRDAWATYWPIPRKDIKELQKSFDHLMDQLYEKLHQEFERNRQKKADVVAQAKALIETADTHTAIEGAKKLQAQWQTIGQCKRKDDQALWQEFRSHCDAIFAKRQQESEALKEERNAAKQQAEDILGQLEEILAKSGEEFFAGRTRAEALQSEFQAIGELPRENARAIASRFHELVDALHKKASSERKATIARAWHSVFTLADQVRLYENAVLLSPANASAEEVQTAIAQAKFQWPQNAKDILEHRLQNAASLTKDKQLEAEQQLRILCIRSEILTDRVTPESDKALRLQYQVENLKQNFGQGLEVNDAAMLELFREWLAVPAASSKDYPPLEKRFLACWLAGE